MGRRGCRGPARRIGGRAEVQADPADRLGRDADAADAMDPLQSADLGEPARSAAPPPCLLIPTANCKPAHPGPSPDPLAYCSPL